VTTLHRWAAALILALVFVLTAATSQGAEKVELLNASYDVSRELFTRINPAFQAAWKAKTGQDLVIRQSHGGSSKQARAVAEGLPADVVTFNQVTDIDFLVKTGLIAPGWEKRLPDRASPFYSLPVFLVRAGNPKKIADWSDLARPGVQPVFPNPKTSGNGRYTYLAAYAYALRKNNGDPAKAQAFVASLLKNVPVFDTGGRGATTTFVERQIGDVLITFESEVSAIRREYAKAELVIVYPSLSLRADFPVAVVDKVVDRRGTRDVANAYLQFLFSEAGQDVLAAGYNRVRNSSVLNRYRTQFPPVTLVSVEEVFGSWDSVTQTHFGDGGILDRLLATQR
jgi:sulfate/thiosulfate transport system substrate-binding protein